MNEVELQKRGISKLTMSSEEKAALIEYDNLILFPIPKFNMLHDHQSFRPGKKHVFFGQAGKGKTTLVRTFMAEIGKSKRILWFSSEENLEETKTTLAKADIPNEVLVNISFVHEDTIKEKSGGNIDKALNIIMESIIQADAEIIIYDNLTTSEFFDLKKPDEAASFYNGLSSIMKQFKKPLILLAHTSASQKEINAINAHSDMVRGLKISTNKAEFVYYVFELTVTVPHKQIIGVEEERRLTFVKTLKSRGKNTQGNIYQLIYDKEKSIYSHDVVINHKVFAQIADSKVSLVTKNKKGKKDE